MSQCVVFFKTGNDTVQPLVVQNGSIIDPLNLTPITIQDAEQAHDIIQNMRAVKDIKDITKKNNITLTGTSSLRRDDFINEMVARWDDIVDMVGSSMVAGKGKGKGKGQAKSKAKSKAKARAKALARTLSSSSSSSEAPSHYHIGTASYQSSETADTHEPWSEHLVDDTGDDTEVSSVQAFDPIPEEHADFDTIDFIDSSDDEDTNINIFGFNFFQNPNNIHFNFFTGARM
jgi:hypothetical protein